MIILHFYFFIYQQELIQNADDAHATKVVFIHDNRSYGTENLWEEDLAKYQGKEREKV